MKFFKQKNNNAGFTLIELMVAISLFTMLVTIGIGALLNANAVHKKNQKIRSLMDNLSFIMEDMSTNIRTGSDYNENISNTDMTEFSFINHNDDTNPLWKYSFVEENNVVNLYKSTPGHDDVYRLTSDTSDDATLINPTEIIFDYGSGFDIIGAEKESVAHDAQQPYVIIKLSGVIKYKDDTIPFSIESSVSQRLVDIDTN